MMRYRFYGPIHVLDHADGSQYPYELLEDVYVVRWDCQRFAIPGRQSGLLPREGYRTDFASIPGRRSLKKLLEPQNLIRAEYDASIKWAVWVYRMNNGVQELLGYFVDRVAYAAIMHDWLYSTRQVSCAFANEIFDDILRGAKVWSAWLMYQAVSIFGSKFYNSYPIEEVREDRELGRIAMDRFFAAIPDLSLEAAPPYLSFQA